MQHMLRMGIDVGSTTVKVVLLDEHDNYLYKKYVRHYANILDTVYTLLQEAQAGHEDDLVHVCITGSGGMANQTIPDVTTYLTTYSENT